MQLTKETAKVGLMVVINDNMRAAARFTKGKPYVIIDVFHDKIGVRDDDNILRTLYFRRFDIFEEKKVKYWLCIKGSINALVGSRYAVDNTLRRDNLLLINGRWQSVSRFEIVEIPEQVAPKKEEKPAPPPPKSLAQLLKEAQDKERVIGMCSYAIMNDKGVVKYQINDICHARIRPYDLQGPFTGVSLMVEYHAQKIRNHESPEEEILYLRAIDYILNRSPWSSIYINKDFKKNFGCVDLDVNRGIHSVACAAIALRTCSEYTSNNKTFCALVDAGVNEHVAYIVAHSCMSKGVSNNSGGHHVFSTACTFDSVLSFFKTGKFIKEGTPYKDNQERYMIVSSQFVEDINHKHKDKQLGTWLINRASNIPTFKKIDKWGAVAYQWEVPNNLIPIAYQLEKEFHNV